MDQQQPSVADARIDEEDIRLTTGFADIFTAILLVVGGILLASILGFVGGIAIVGAAFVLGGPLVERRRFAASGNVLAVGAALGTGVTLGWPLGLAVLIPVALVSYGFWWIHRVPLALALAWMAGAGLITGLELFDSFDRFEAVAAVRALLAGLLLFGAAMWYDSRDPLRRTRLTDVAFWLHLGAAPLLVHGFFSVTGAGPFGDADQVRPVFVLGTFAVLAAASLLIDRRPLLASSFVYLVAATYRLMRDASAASNLGERELAAAMAPAVIGVLLLFLAAGWTPLRSLLLRAVPADLARFLSPAARRSAPAPERPAALPVEEHEPVRLVLGFNDFFVALGAASLFVGCIFVGVQLVMVLSHGAFIDDAGRYAGNNPALAMQAFDSGVWLFWIPIALPGLAMWLVAEYFVRIRRMAWPAIVSAISFGWTTMALGAYAVAAWWYATSRAEFAEQVGVLGSSPPHPSAALALGMIAAACAIAALASLAFWWRHRVPISFALACATLIPLAFAPELARLLSGQEGAFEGFSGQVRLILCGLAAFAVALAWDRSDTARTSPRSDTAFWMHLLAGLLVIPSSFSLLPAAALGQVAALIGFALLTVLAVAIDRRAPLVVGLPFLAKALNALVGDPAGPVLTLITLVLLLALVLRWDQARSWLLTRAALQAA
ncbi:MAG: hypothetical protein ACKOPG_11440 [Novosphingobium sp.]